MSGATITQAGSLNTTALTNPGLYIDIQTPQAQLAGAPTNIVGYVGTAVWGPVNQATIVSGQTDGTAAFGPLQNRKYDLMTGVTLGQVIGGSSNFRAVRVTDGTDTAASFTIPSATISGAPAFWTAAAAALASGTGALRGPSNLVILNGTSGVLTARYTGSLGNYITVTTSTGTQANTMRIVVGLAAPNMPSLIEVFDNIPAATAPTAATYTLTGGTDGATTITAATLVGQNAALRTGMYALMQQGCSVIALCDADDSTQWTTQAQFGLTAGAYMICTGPSGDTIANATTTKVTAGLDTYAAKLMFGDWLYWYDPVNKVTRLVSPASIVAGLLGNLAPNDSTLNKELLGIIGSQKAGAPGTPQANTYSAAEIGALAQAGIGVIASPSPGGNYWSCRTGRNASSNAAINGDNYTRMTNFLAASIGGTGGMGQFIGQPVTGTGFFRTVRATLLAYLGTIYNAGYLPTYGTTLPYAVQCDDPTVQGTNNPQASVSLGYVIANVQVQLQSITWYLIVNLTDGQTVTVTSTAPSAS